MMDTGKRYRKLIAWMLITTLAYPAAVALARDTDIFLNPARIATAAELKEISADIARGHPSTGIPTIPISAFNRAENSNDVYIGFFQPEPSTSWKGTLKKYQLGRTEAECGAGVTFCLMGQTLLGNPEKCGNQGGGNCRNVEFVETNPVTGVATSKPHGDAVSYWNPPPPALSADGARADQGGTGYQLLNQTGYYPSTRNVYTFLSNGVSSQTALTHASNLVRDTNVLINNAAVIPATTTDAQRSVLINHALGGDKTNAACSDASAAGTPCTTWRAWAHADVQHSRPAVVTYDAGARPPVEYVFYASNDGLLHAVDGSTGKEKWAFLIEEAYSKLAAMAANSNGPALDLADGSVSLWVNDGGDGVVSGSDKVYLYFGQRRGGSTYYALDISNRDAPVFKWKIVGGKGVAGAGRLCSGTGACTAIANYDELGQSWSTPVVTRVRAPGGAGTLALVFGGGYDPAEDTIPRGTRTMGRALYVVNAESGDLINAWGVGQPGTYRGGSVAMADAIPSDVTAINVDSDAQGFIDRIYAGDVGGNVWRIDVNRASATTWQAKQIARLSEASGESRKFLFAPTIVKQVVPERYDAVYIGSGDREHPTTSSTSTPAHAHLDMMFMIKDDPRMEAPAGAPVRLADLLTRADGDVSQLNASALADPVMGWMRALQDGEKVTGPSTVFFNKLRFASYAPLALADARAPRGQGRLNVIDALTGNLFDLNRGGSVASTDRYYGSFLTNGYNSSVVIVSGGKISVATFGFPKVREDPVTTLGAPMKIYWYMEPEQ